MIPAKGALACATAILMIALGTEATGQTENHESLGDVSLKVTGIGKAPETAHSPGQRRLMAERAAEIVAERNLGLAVGNVTVEGTEQHKKIFVDAFVRGARVTDRKQLPDGSVEVTMELPLSEVARNFAQMQRLLTQAEENRKKLERAFKKTEDDLHTVKTKLQTFQEEMEKIESHLKGIEGGNNP